MALDQVKEEKEMSFFEHIDELRKHLFKSALVLAITTLTSLFFINDIFHKIIIGPLRNDFVIYELICKLSKNWFNNEKGCLKPFDIALQNTEMAGQFMMAFKLSFLVGLIVSMPYILYQIWSFIRPALNIKEVKAMRGFVFYTTFLFLLGVSFGYFILSPISINFLSSYKLSSMVKNEINIQSVISFMSLLAFGTGLIFELPILIYFLARIGIVSSSFLKKYRKHAFLIILIVSGILTPPDVVSQIVLTIPLYSLFELGILIASRVEKKKEALILHE